MRKISDKQLKTIYADKKRLADFRAGRDFGIRAAAGFIGQFDSQITHAYRIEDCVLAKFNLIKGKPRKKPVAEPAPPEKEKIKP